MLYTCKCLNILVEADETKVQMDTSSVEENPQKYFTEGAKHVEIRKITKQVDSLVQGRMLKNKTVIYKCLNCCLDCYSLSDDKKTAFVNSTLISDLETVKKLRNDTNFSPAFRIIISTVPEKKQPLVMHKQANAERLQSAVLSLQKQFSDLVQEQIAKTEDRIKTFSEQEHIRLKEYRDRAQRDHKCLIEALYAAEPFFYQQQPTCIAENDSVGSRETAPIEVQSVKNKTETRAPGTITAGSINKEKKPLPQHQHQRLREKNGSFDSEGLFAIEGMEDWPSDDLGKSEGESDTDHDDSGSHDEGIDIHRKKEDYGQLAKSLPVNVPVCSNVNVEFEGEDEPSDAVDIAASIKALARSLHGDAVFGDLPRPRFSTQI